VDVTRRDIFDDCVEQGNNIFVFWHSRLFYLVYYYVMRSPRRKACMLVSLSRDGDYGAALVRRLKQDVVRGSSSRGGQAAVRKLVSRLRGGSNVAITPDGPRGPALVVGEGVVKLAQMTGARIIPVSYDASRKFLLKSWDRFIVVKPFGRVHVAFGEPIRVPRRISADGRRECVNQIEQALRTLDGICSQELARRAAGFCEQASVSAVPPAPDVTRPEQARVG
jgi:lysophospholipid acyltransferase (LPLAT)-like uncharacterized protein